VCVHAAGWSRVGFGVLGVLSTILVIPPVLVSHGNQPCATCKHTHRGADWVPPPKKAVQTVNKSILIPPGTEHTGTWRTVGGVRCYEAGSPSDGPPLVMLPDMFRLEEDTPASLRVSAHVVCVLWCVLWCLGALRSGGSVAHHLQSASAPPPPPVSPEPSQPHNTIKCPPPPQRCVTTSPPRASCGW